MNVILIAFFVLPLVTILLAIVLQKILRSPILVAITFFAIYLIVAFVAFSDTLAEALIAVIVYTIIAYITALIVMIICKCRRRFCSSEIENETRYINPNTMVSVRNRCMCNDEDNENNSNTENNLLKISCRCGNSDQSNDLLTVDSICFANNINNNENTIRGVKSTPNLSETAFVTDMNNATMYGNIGRGNMTRRIYRRF